MRLLREVFTTNSTSGRLLLDGKFECYTLEDMVRSGPKIRKETAIPVGRYEVVVTFSERFQRLMPLLLKVPGFEGIRIHSGNTKEDTEGCPLVGQKRAVDMVLNSRAAFKTLFPKIREACRVGKVFITVENADAED